MHRNGLVVSLKSNGEFLKEIQDEVYLPFNCTYEIYLKNTTSDFACIDVFVDGKTVITDLLLDPHSNTTVSRFLEGNMEEGHSLKFIQLSEEIKNYRGEQRQDGELKVRWKYGQREYAQWRPNPFPNPSSPWNNSQPWNQNEIFRDWQPCKTYTIDASTVDAYFSNISNDTMHCDASVDMHKSPMFVRHSVKGATGVRGLKGPSASVISCYASDKGITTTGKPVQQTFTKDTRKFKWNWQSDEIILRMYGADRALKKEMLCDVCGLMVNVKQGPYCPRCGTYLL